MNNSQSVRRLLATAAVLDATTALLQTGIASSASAEVTGNFVRTVPGTRHTYGAPFRVVSGTGVLRGRPARRDHQTRRVGRLTATAPTIRRLAPVIPAACASRRRRATRSRSVPVSR